MFVSVSPLRSGWRGVRHSVFYVMCKPDDAYVGTGAPRPARRRGHAAVRAPATFLAAGRCTATQALGHV